MKKQDVARAKQEYWDNYVSISRTISVLDKMAEDTGSDLLKEYAGKVRAGCNGVADSVNLASKRCVDASVLLGHLTVAALYMKSVDDELKEKYQID